MKLAKQIKLRASLTWVKTLLSSVVLSAAIVPHASAHLMVAQHGTLNFKGDGVFMVLSLPVSSFDNIDDDGDGKMSPAEFVKHRQTIIKAVNEKVSLRDKGAARPLQGLLLSPVVPHIVPNAPSKQIIAMGRFALADADAAKSNDLTFHLGLFGKTTEEKSLALKATRKLSADTKAEVYKMTLTAEKNETPLFAKQ